MMRQTIAVLFGGCSSEHEVSLQSACSVIENLNMDRYRRVLLGITRDGEWMKYEGPVEQIRNGTWRESNLCVPAVISPDRKTHGILALERDSIKEIRIDAAFPVLHGKNGEDGTVQGLLELAGIPYAGCGALSSAVCMDKDVAHRLAHLAGVKTPRSVSATVGVTDAALCELTAELKYPLFVKPANAGSSFGISIATSAEVLPQAAAEAFRYDRKIVVEEAIEGFEVGCAVLGNGSLTVGEVDEIELKQSFFDYAEKYSGKTSRIHLPARVSAETAQRIKQTAKKIYRALNCAGFARVDMFLTPDGDIVFNEVNTIPGFTTHSRYPNMLRGIGMTMEQIVDEVIRLAVEEH